MYIPNELIIPLTTYRKLYDTRAGVLAGQVEVAKAEDGTLSEAPGAGANAATEGEEAAKGTAGMPGFWLRAMMNHGMLQECVTEEDAPALEYLSDVRCIDKEDYTVRRGGFCLGGCGVGGWGWVPRAPASFSYIPHATTT